MKNPQYKLMMLKHSTAYRFNEITNNNNDVQTKRQKKPVFRSLKKNNGWKKN